MYQGVPQICSACGYRPPSTRESIELNIPCKQCGYIGVSNGPQLQRPVPHQEPQMVRTAEVPLSEKCLHCCFKRESPSLGYQLPPPNNKTAPIFQPNQQSTPIAQPRAPVQQNGGYLQMPHVSSIRMPTGQFVPPEQCLQCCFRQGPQEPGFKPPLSINIPAPTFQPTQQSTPKAKSGLPALQDGHYLQMPQLSSIAPLDRPGGLGGGVNEFRVRDGASGGAEQWYNLPSATDNAIQSPNLLAPAQAPAVQLMGPVQQHPRNLPVPAVQPMVSVQQQPSYMPAPAQALALQQTPSAEGRQSEVPEIKIIPPTDDSVVFHPLSELRERISENQYASLPNARGSQQQPPNLPTPPQAPALQPMGSVQQQLRNLPAPAVQPVGSVQQQHRNLLAPAQAPAEAPALQPVGSVQQQLRNLPAPSVQPMGSVQQQPHNLPAPVQAPAFLQGLGAAGIQSEIPGLIQRPPRNSLVLLPFSDLLELSQNQSDTRGSQLLQQAAVPGLSQANASGPDSSAQEPKLSNQQSTESSATGSKFGPLCFVVLQPITQPLRPLQLQASNGLKPPGPPTAGAAAAAASQNQPPQAARDSLSTSSRAPEELGQRLLAGIHQREMFRRGSKPQSGDAGNIRQLQTEPPEVNDAATSQQPLSEIQPKSAIVIQNPAVAEEQRISSQEAALARPQRPSREGASQAVSSQTGQHGESQSSEATHDSQVESPEQPSRLQSILASADDSFGSSLDRIRRDFGIAQRLNRRKYGLL